MAIPRLNESCCGCSLQTGCKIIGWFHLISTIITLVISVLQLANGRLIILSTPQGVITVQNPNYDYLIVVSIAMLINLLVATSLLIGAYQQHAIKVLVWLVYNIVMTIIYLLMNLFITITIIIAGAIGIGIAYLIVGIIAILIQGYLMLVVYSFYKQLKEELPNVATYTTA